MTLSEPMALTQKPEHSSSPTPTAFGMLFRLPPELRLNIYRELLLNGSVRILESSKAIHGEAIGVLLQEGVCRLEFKTLDILPNPSYCNTLMNLEIRIGSEKARLGRCFNRLRHWLASFLNVKFTPHGTQPPIEPTLRKSCKIGFYESEKMMYLDPIFEIISCMNGFEELMFVFPVDPAESMFGRDTRSYDSGREPHRWTPRATVCEKAPAALEPTLGPAQMIRDGVGVSMQFRPRAHYLRGLEQKQA